MFKQMFLPTERSFDAERLTSIQRNEVLKSVAAMPPEDRPYARWMAQRWSGGSDVLVFAARPVASHGNGYSPWIAANAHVFINPVTCDIGALPPDAGRLPYSLQPPLGPTAPSDIATKRFHVREYQIPTPQNDLRGIAEGPDGAFWFAEASPYTTHTGSIVYGNRIARITSNGTVTEFEIPTPDANPDDIVAASDGDLWFTELIGNRIGRITTSGKIIEYSLPLTAGEKRGMVFPPRGRTLGPRGIAVGPDGALWFTEALGGRIGRISIDGAIEEFKVPRNTSSLGYIASDGHRALWFTLNEKIGKITTAGNVTLYDAAGVTDLDRIVSGPDGNMWIAEFNGRITMITAKGRLVEYTIPTPGSYPEDIVVGCDGALWFSEFGPGALGRITPGGKITEYALHIRELSRLALGPNCSLWFTETSDADKVGRLQIPPQP